MQVAFEGEIILTQHCIENKRNDAYFSKCKLGVEIDDTNTLLNQLKNKPDYQLKITILWSSKKIDRIRI